VGLRGVSGGWRQKEKEKRKRTTTGYHLSLGSRWVMVSRWAMVSRWVSRQVVQSS